MMHFYKKYWLVIKRFTMHKDFDVNFKQIMFWLYLIYTIGYTFVFFIKNKTLHFEHWLFIAIVSYLIYVVVFVSIDRFIKSIIHIGILSSIAIAFNISLKSNATFESILKSTCELVLNFCPLFANAYFYIFVFISIFYFIARICTENLYVKKYEDQLYKEREQDKNTIVNFLKNKNNFNVLGIDENFGVGKTFVVNQALQELDINKFEIIKIRCLLLDKDDIYPYLIKQLNKVLINNLIFEGHFEKIKSSIIKNIDSKYTGIFSLFIRESKIDDIENFKQALFKLNKNIVLVFDDFDRGSNCEKIDKLFSFIDDFSENNIKSLVLFSSSSLKNISQSYTRDYIEKYIPYIMSLTQINFKELLYKEIDKLHLNRKDFLFLVAIFHDNLIYEDFNQKIKDLEFFYDLHYMISLNMVLNSDALNITITARKIRNFVNELQLYFNAELKIERRLIIAYVFCKVFLYEDFYEKIDRSFDDFENIFPIHIKLLQANISLTLEEFDILYSLSYREDVRLQNIFHFIDLGVKNILFTQGYEGNSNHINYYLNKLGLSSLRDFSPESVIKSLDSIKNILNTNTKQLELTSSNIANMLIYTIFNYKMIACKNKNKVVENHESIINAIKKLKFIGNKDQLSSYKLYYDGLVKCLQLPTIKERKDSYIILKQDCSNNINGMHNVCRLFVDRWEVKSMLILDVFDDLQNQEILFDLIFYINNNYITDDYINAFINCKKVNLKIADFIISKFIENKCNINNINTLNNIRFHLNKFIIREYSIPFISNMDYKGHQISNKSLYIEYKKYLEFILSCNNIFYDVVKCSKKIQDHLSMIVRFFNKLLELEDSGIQVEQLANISVTTYPSKEANQIQKLTDDNEKIKFLEKLYLEQGVTLDSINRLFNTSNKN